jgi:hypothetical protein
MCQYLVQVPGNFTYRPLARPTGERERMNSEAYNFTFDYIPELPRVNSSLLRLIEAKTASLKISATFMFPTQASLEFECKVEASKAEGTAMPYTPVEFVLSGLYPLTYYQLECEVWLRDNPRIRSDPSTPKFLSTAPDTNGRLRALNLSATPLCDGSPAGVPLRVGLYPAFTPELLYYSAGVRTEEHPGGCAADAQSWLFNLTADAESLFAGVIFSSQVLKLADGELAAKTDPDLTVEIQPLQSSISTFYTVQATVADFFIGIDSVWQDDDGDGVEASDEKVTSGALGIKPGAPLVVKASNVNGAPLTAEECELSLGPLKQDATVEITGNLVTFTVEKVYGLGKLLPVSITAKGAAFREELYVNFTGAGAEPTLTAVETGLLDDDGKHVASLSGDTELRILGTQFGAYDMLVLPVPIIEVRVTKAGVYEENICGPTTWVSDEELTCVLPPGLVSPLEVSVWVLQGSHMHHLAASELGLVDYIIPTVAQNTPQAVRGGSRRLAEEVPPPLELPPDLPADARAYILKAAAELGIGPPVEPRYSAAPRALSDGNETDDQLVIDPFDPVSLALVFEGSNFPATLETQGQVWLDGVGTGTELCTRPLVRLSPDLFLCDIAFPLNMGPISTLVCRDPGLASCDGVSLPSVCVPDETCPELVDDNLDELLDVGCRPCGDASCRVAVCSELGSAPVLQIGLGDLLPAHQRLHLLVPGGGPGFADEILRRLLRAVLLSGGHGARSQPLRESGGLGVELRLRHHRPVAGVPRGPE